MKSISILTALVSFFMGGLSFSSGVKHLLMMLVSLEFMAVMVFFMAVNVPAGHSQYIGIVLLIFSVCEGALGLTILVAMARGMGGGFFDCFSLSHL